MSDGVNNVAVFPGKAQPLHLTVEDLLNMEGALVTLSNTKGLPTKTAYRIARLISKLKPDYAEASTKRQELLDRFGTPAMVDDGQGNMRPSGTYNFEPDKIGAFNAEYAELLKEPVVLAGWLPLKLEDFAEADIMPSHLIAMEKSLAPSELELLDEDVAAAPEPEIAAEA